MGKVTSISSVTEERAFEAAQEYSILRDQEKSIKERKEVLSNLLKTYATEHGHSDDKGSRYVENDSFIFGSQCRRSVSFKPTAIEWLKKKGLNDAIIVTESIDTEGVERYIDSGDINVEELEQQTTVKETYAIDVKIKSGMPEVTQFEVAASSKSSSLFGRKR